MASTETSTTGTGSSQTLMPSSEPRTASENTDPTDRSMPPDNSTMASASTIRPNSAIWRPRSVMLDCEKKSGNSEPNTATVTISARNGIALSIQRFESISPTRCAGRYLYESWVSRSSLDIRT